MRLPGRSSCSTRTSLSMRRRTPGRCRTINRPGALWNKRPPPSDRPTLQITGRRLGAPGASNTLCDGAMEVAFKDPKRTIFNGKADRELVTKSYRSCLDYTHATRRPTRAPRKYGRVEAFATTPDASTLRGCLIRRAQAQYMIANEPFLAQAIDTLLLRFYKPQTDRRKREERWQEPYTRGRSPSTGLASQAGDRFVHSCRRRDGTILETAEPTTRRLRIRPLEAHVAHPSDPRCRRRGAGPLRQIY
eukprot:3960061-Prymnesium_polylepis.1